MFKLLNKAFGSKQPNPPKTGAQRTVDLSGNLLRFALPENFSKDLPANPLVESVDLTHKLAHAKSLLQRWWDIKEPKLFGSNLGTLMMTLSLYPVPKNTQQRLHGDAYNLADRLDLIFLVIEQLKDNYTDADGNRSTLYSIPSLSSLGNQVVTGFRDCVFNRQKWTGYSISGPNSSTVVESVIPIDQHHFLKVSFTYAPNSHIAPLYFHDYAVVICQAVEATLHIEYDKNNPMKQLVEETWLNHSITELTEENNSLLLEKIFDRTATSPPLPEPNWR